MFKKKQEHFKLKFRLESKQREVEAEALDEKETELFVSVDSHGLQIYICDDVFMVNKYSAMKTVSFHFLRSHHVES